MNKTYILILSVSLTILICVSLVIIFHFVSKNNPSNNFNFNCCNNGECKTGQNSCDYGWNKVDNCNSCKKPLPPPHNPCENIKCKSNESCINGNCYENGQYSTLGRPNDSSILPEKLPLTCDCPTKMENKEEGTLTFEQIIPANVYEMFFPFHNKIYTYTGLIEALKVHPKGHLIGGEGSNDDRKRDIAAFFANTAHETGNGNGPPTTKSSKPVIDDINSNTTDKNGPWTVDQTYLFDHYGNKYFQCKCINPESCKNQQLCKIEDCNGGTDSNGNFWSWHTVSAGQYCGPGTEEQPAWLGGLTCINEACPEYPGVVITKEPGDYCEPSNDFSQKWQDGGWKAKGWNNPPDNMPFQVYGGTTANPCSEDEPCPCVMDENGNHKKYYGRGPIQLSYPFNYGTFSWQMYKLGITTDPYYISKNPELIENDPKWIWLSAVHFWVSPSDKWGGLSAHDAMVFGSKQKGGGIGCAINIVNNECEQYTDVYFKTPTSNAGNRIAWYRTFCDALGVSVEES